MADRPIELALNSAIGGAGESTLVALLDRLIVLLTSIGPDDPALNPGAFRSLAEHWRDSLRSGTSDVRDAIASGVGLVDECERYFDRVKAYEGEREAEVAEVVSVAREVLRTLRGGADEFEEGFAQSASAFARIGDISDIRELRRALASEVETLRHLVATRKEQDAATFAKLSNRVERLEASLIEARDEAAKDGLTGVANRRTFDRTLARFLARTGRARVPFTLALVDIDDFKLINDEHGHPIGDRVLVCVSRLLTGGVRTNDLVARYGGEEFAILMDQTTTSQARTPLQRLIDHLATSYEYEHETGTRQVSFSFSIGATELAEGDTRDEIVRRADEALYRAKRKGKRRLESSSQTLLRRLLG